MIVPRYFEDLSVLHENTLDHRMAGIGSKSCGPDLSEQYRIDEDTYRFAFLIRPERVDGTMYSCTSLGTKLGGGIGTALAGWLLAFSGYVGKAAEQSASTLNMLHIMYLWMPMIFNLLITLILTRLNVEQANEELRAGKAGV